MVILGLIVCSLVIVMNILVMVAIFINRRFHYPIYYLLGNLAAADLFAGIAYMHLMFHTGPWTMNLDVYHWFIRQVQTHNLPYITTVTNISHIHHISHINNL